MILNKNQELKIINELFMREREREREREICWIEYNASYRK